MPLPHCCSEDGGIPAIISPLPYYTEADYTAALLNLLPSGRAWPKWEGSNLYKTIAALSGTYSRDVGATVGEDCSAFGSQNRCVQLLLDTLPYWNALGSSAVAELLPEWQITVGLPDECFDETFTLEQQMRQVVARFVGISNESVCMYVQYAKHLGYDITITELAPFRADITRPDAPVADELSVFYWQIEVHDPGFWEFESDLNVGGDPLGGTSLGPLACEFEKLKPLHSRIIWHLT